MIRDDLIQQKYTLTDFIYQKYTISGFLSCLDILERIQKFSNDVEWDDNS